MPATLTYPGVYIEEVPSGVRTIVGVATSITAFLGRAIKGPVDDPVTINNFGDFERAFGGLGLDYPMSYAVRDFFNNGGVQAIVVRMYPGPKAAAPAGGGGGGGGGGGAGGGGGGDAGGGGGGSGGGPAGGTALIDLPPTDGKTVELEAASAGSWANTLRARIDHDVPQDPAAGKPHPLPWVDAFGLKSADLFNLTVRDSATGATEKFVNLTVKPSPRRVDRVLQDESSFVRLHGDPTQLPDKVPTAHKKIDDPAKDPVWTSTDFSSPVAQAHQGADSADLTAGAFTTGEADKKGMFALEKADLFNLLCIPPDKRGGDTSKDIYDAALTYCVKRRAVLVVDPPAGWKTAANARDHLGDAISAAGVASRNAAIYFPRVRMADPLLDGKPDTFVPCGVVAGVMARTDAQRGVWKAPAGLDAALLGTQGLSVKMTDAENGMLNPLGINCLRSFPTFGSVIWGARTLRGADQLADEYKYLPVRRLALYIEESLYRGTQWVVFEPNDKPLWSQIRLNVGAFMQNLFRQGAFQGSTPRDAYFVKVDEETTTQNDINLGIVNIVVGFAPLKPAEFVVIKIQQIAGQIQA